MKYILALVLTIQCSLLFGQINLEVDTDESTMEINVLGASDTTGVDGGGIIELSPSTKPFSTARYTDFQISAADGLTISLLGGFVTLETLPGDLALTLVVPGGAGNVTNNEFDQVGNLVQLSGMLMVTDPAGLFGGTQTVDLSDSKPSILDLLDVGIEVIDGQLRVGGPFDVTIETGIDVAGVEITVQVVGSIFMVGELDNFLLGDVNLDGSVDLLDVSPFVDLIASGTYQLEADIDMNGEVDLLDVVPFVELLTGG